MDINRAILKKAVAQTKQGPAQVHLLQFVIHHYDTEKHVIGKYFKVTGFFVCLFLGEGHRI